MVANLIQFGEDVSANGPVSDFEKNLQFERLLFIVKGCNEFSFLVTLLHFVSQSLMIKSYELKFLYSRDMKEIFQGFVLCLRTLLSIALGNYSYLI